MKVSIISLGCPKNRVDSEVIIGSFGAKGYEITQFPEEADIIIINTCSFIESARTEAYKVIKKISKLKAKNSKLLVCGCLPQLTGDKLLEEFPQIDAIIGSADFYKIPEIVFRLKNTRERITEINSPSFIYNSHMPRLVSTPPSYVYLKIAEGCSNCCSYCRIPQLRGKYRSREVKDIVAEANKLLELGYKELIIIAQDTTNFGYEKGKNLLPRLLKELSKLNGIHWIRLLYTHPAHFSNELISIIENNPRICKYIDLPLQHTHPDLLKLMNRPLWEPTKALIRKLQKAGIVIRTTFLVGFPEEKGIHFNKLLADVEELEFDWVGAFTYSYEINTPAAKSGDRVPFKLKQERLQKLMDLQKKITKQKNLAKTGKNYEILVDCNYNNYAVGHSEFQCPEIDGKCYCPTNYTPGALFKGKVKNLKNNYDIKVIPS